MKDTIDYDNLRKLINNVHNEAIKSPCYNAVRKALPIIFKVHGVQLFGMYDLALWINKMRPGTPQFVPVSTPTTAPPRVTPPRPIVTHTPMLPPPLVQLQPADYDPTLLGYMFKEIYDSGYDFAGCKNPDMLQRFIHPNDNKWDMRHDELTGQQKKTVTTIGIHYRDWRLAQGYIPGYLIRRASRAG
jgi:hypothetical protein